RSFVSVQGALVMYPIYSYGSEAQKNKWLPLLQQGKAIGCFGLTEPQFGSNPGGMLTRAVKKGRKYILNGEKMWITSGSIADVAVVWAKAEDDKVRGFLVEKGTPGFKAWDVHGKWSLRASVTSGLAFTDCEIPEENFLPGVVGLKGPLSCLNQARYGIGWGALGAAMACYDTALQARDILGANGIVDDYCIMRHMNNLESVYTYEGTNDIHKLVIGERITGIAAFV